MAQTDVKIKVEGLQGMPPYQPIGVTITHSIGTVPTLALDFIPSRPGLSKISAVKDGFLLKLDEEKRKNDITVDVSVYSSKGGGTKSKKTLKFVGLLDGVSTGNIVGGNYYQAIIKHRAQRLLELTTITPGLHPVSVNIYKSPGLGLVKNSQKDPQEQLIEWQKIKIDLNKPVIEVYTELMKAIIKRQLDDYGSYLQTEKLIEKAFFMEKIFQDKRYVKALKSALEFFEKIDYSAVKDGGLGRVATARPDIWPGIVQMFANGSHVLLENYLNFLHYINCTLIFGNSKLFVVPQNSVLKQSYTKPAKGQTHYAPNVAYPADYGGYTYSDNGYRDIAHVIVATPNYQGGQTLGIPGGETMAAAHYKDEQQLTQASGVMVVNAHPWLASSAVQPLHNDSKKLAQDIDGQSKSLHDTQIKYQDAVEQDRDAQAKKRVENRDSHNAELEKYIKNYAETKFYQIRYSDREGTINMDFNPDWVPGTGGILFIRETEMYLAFYVNTVSHRIEVSPQNTGSAATTVNFNCARIGPSPIGITEDKFLGYTRAKEQQIQKAYLEDIGVKGSLSGGTGANFSGGSASTGGSLSGGTGANFSGGTGNSSTSLSGGTGANFS